MIEKSILDAFIDSVINPAGGIDNFRVVDDGICQFVQFKDNTGEYFDLVLEDDFLHAVSVECLVALGVKGFTRESASNPTPAFPPGLEFPKLK